MSILLVDDSAAQRAALAGILAAAGFHDLREACSADAALAVLAAAAPGSIDLCLTDLYMPGGSGIEVCRRVRALPPWCDLPLIVLTRRTGNRSTPLGARAGLHHSSLYHHVPGGKAELFVEVMERIYARHRSGLSAGQPRERARQDYDG